MKAIATLTLCGIIVMGVAGFASANLVDDFESSDLGNIDSQIAANGEVWKELNKTSSVVIDDPTDAENQVLSMINNNPIAGVSTGTEIAPGQVATLSFRAWIGRPDGFDTDQVWEIGLSADLSSGNHTRHAMGYMTRADEQYKIGSVSVNSLTWYDVEMVFDLTGDTIDDYTISMFVNGESAGEGVINPGSGNWDGQTPLEFFRILGDGTPWGSGMLIDDIAIGLVPEPMSLSLLGLGGLTLLRRRRA